MARGKKKETLTPEERLQAALMPDWEQPYKVPENWCWVTLETTTSIIMGQSPAGLDTTDDSRYTPLIGGAADMGNIYPKATRYTKRPTKMSTNQDLILCIRATLGKPVYSDKEYCLGRGVAAIRPCIGDRSFYKYFFDTFEQYLYNNATGTTFVQISSQILQKMPLPLPPLPEQQRIVDRIESLFAKLDEAKQKAQDTLDSFETRKAAILHKAFTGELTAQWRKGHGVGMESWENKELWQLAKEIKAGGDKPDDFTEEADEAHNIPVVANGVVDEGIIGYTATARFSGETVTVAGRGTIGFSVYRTYAFFPIVRLIVIQPKDFVKAAYIKYAFDAFPESGTGSSIPQLTVPMVKEKVIPLPKLDEQVEIIRILDALLAKEQQAKEAAEGVLEQIDLIKKAILARAFRGELGTNDPREESAVELLKNMI